MIPKPLTWYPKPSRNRGFCMHVSPGNMMPLGRPEDVDTWLNHAQEMGADWVKLVVDGPNAVDLVRHVKARGFEPILRIYIHEQWPDAMVDRCPQLGDWVRQYVDAGAQYIEIGNEPNLKSEWKGGEANPAEWNVGAQPNRVADAWYRDALVIIAAGGLPGIPALAPGGNYNDIDWTRTFLQYIKERGWEDVLCQGSWIAIHNGTLNHPLDYPGDDVNQRGTQLTQAEYDQFPEWAGDLAYVNEQRRNGKNPGQTLLSVDANGKDTGGSNCFDKFIAYHAIFVQVFGYEIPIGATEGGVWVGTRINDEWGQRIWDPRYPATTKEQQAEWMVAIAQKMMRGGIPDYYLFWCEWCEANMDMENPHRAFENDALFSIRAWGDIGGRLPVVDAMKAMPKQDRVPYADPNPPDPPTPWPDVLSDQQIADVTKQAGFTGEAWTTAVAIILAESGGVVKARGDVDVPGPGDSSNGIWQINTYYHPECYPGGRQDMSIVHDPLLASVEAFRISEGGQNFRAWSTYTQYTYPQYWGRALAVTGGEQGPTEDELKNAAWLAMGVNYNPDAALAKYAAAQGLGVPLCNEYTFSIDCQFFVGQVYSGNGGSVFCYCAHGDWGNVKEQVL